jgi:hypothetical protein
VTAAGLIHRPATTLRHRHQLHAEVAACAACQHHRTTQASAEKLPDVLSFAVDKRLLSCCMDELWLQDLCTPCAACTFNACCVDHAIALICIFRTANHTFGVYCYENAWLPWAAADVPHFLWVHPTGLCYKLVMSRVILKQPNLLTTHRQANRNVF